MKRRVFIASSAGVAAASFLRPSSGAERKMLAGVSVEDLNMVTWAIIWRARRCARDSF